MSRSSIISKIKTTAGKLNANAKAGVVLTWQLAEQVTLLRGTFPQGSDHAKAFLATAATASGKGEATIKNLVRAVEVRDSLTKAQRQKVSGWSYDSVLALATADPRQRTTMIAKAERQGTDAKTVRKIRSAVVGVSERQRQNAADKTTALAETIRDWYESAVAAGHPPVALIAGAQVAQDHPGKDIAGAILFLSAQVTKAEPVVAK